MQEKFAITILRGCVALLHLPMKKKEKIGTKRHYFSKNHKNVLNKLFT